MKPNELVCWIENGEQHWEMIKGEDNDVFLLNLLQNNDIWKHSIFIIPTTSIMCGAVWLWKDTHKDWRVDFWNFFEELNVPYKKPTTDEKTEKLAEEIKKKTDDDTLYGFISPDGRYFHCCFQGHSNLADNICFGFIDTNNAERYLEEHGWIKIYNPLSEKSVYDVYMGEDGRITDEQMRTLIDMGLDKTAGVKTLLARV